MPLIASSYQAPFYLPGGHSQTIVPALFRKVKIPVYVRQALDLPDGDFLLLDWLKHTTAERKRALLIITHGLEGDTQRPYVRGMAKKFYEAGYDVLAWNHRGCGGQINRLLRFYHNGSSEDLREVVDYVLKEQPHYEKISLAGFSLGGNMTLKFLGEESLRTNPRLHRAAVFSVPLHISSCSQALSKPSNRVYALRFMKSLKEKVRQKAARMPDKINTNAFKHLRTLKDFDNYYTAPLHGFADAEDYYERSSSLYFLPSIVIPTLIVNAQNDPFLAPPCFPYDLLEGLDRVYFEVPRGGGHCGFSPTDTNGHYWSEQRAFEFIESPEF